MIDASAAPKRILLTTPCEDIAPGTAIQGVTPQSTNQDIITCSTIEHPALVCARPRQECPWRVKTFCSVLDPAPSMIDLPFYILGCSRVKIADLDFVIPGITCYRSAPFAGIGDIISRTKSDRRVNITQASQINRVIAKPEITHHLGHAGIGLIPAIIFHMDRATRPVKRDRFATILVAEILPCRSARAKIEK